MHNRHHHHLYQVASPLPHHVLLPEKDQTLRNNGHRLLSQSNHQQKDEFLHPVNIVLQNTNHCPAHQGAYRAQTSKRLPVHILQRYIYHFRYSHTKIQFHLMLHHASQIQNPGQMNDTGQGPMAYEDIYHPHNTGHRHLYHRATHMPKHHPSPVPRQMYDTHHHLHNQVESLCQNCPHPGQSIHHDNYQIPFHQLIFRCQRALHPG